MSISWKGKPSREPTKRRSSFEPVRIAPWWCQTRLRPRSRTGFCGSRSRAHPSSRNEASRFGDATPSRRMIGSESNHASPARP